MTAINFPDNPAAQIPANTFSATSTPAASTNGINYLWDGAKWVGSSNPGGLLTATTAVTVSGASVDFRGIPSWVKRITVMFNGVSTNGTSSLLIQVGAGSVQTTNYTSLTLNQIGAPESSTSGLLAAGTVFAAATHCGLIFITLLGSNTWVQSGTLTNTNGTSAAYSGGRVDVLGTLDRLRLTTVNGTDTFDAGSISILYEG